MDFLHLFERHGRFMPVCMVARCTSSDHDEAGVVGGAARRDRDLADAARADPGAWRRILRRPARKVRLGVSLVEPFFGLGGFLQSRVNLRSLSGQH
jgi:hypothetical protein